MHCTGMQYAFGPRRGLWFIIPFQLIVMVRTLSGTCMTLTVFHALHSVVCSSVHGNARDAPFMLQVGLAIVYCVTGGGR